MGEKQKPESLFFTGARINGTADFLVGVPSAIDISQLSVVNAIQTWVTDRPRMLPKDVDIDSETQLYDLTSQEQQRAQTLAPTYPREPAGFVVQQIGYRNKG